MQTASLYGALVLLWCSSSILFKGTDVCVTVYIRYTYIQAAEGVLRNAFRPAQQGWETRAKDWAAPSGTSLNTTYHLCLWNERNTTRALVEPETRTSAKTDTVFCTHTFARCAFFLNLAIDSRMSVSFILVNGSKERVGNRLVNMRFECKPHRSKSKTFGLYS